LANCWNYHVVCEISELSWLFEVTLLGVIELKLDHTCIGKNHISILPSLIEANSLLRQLSLHHHICEWI
jgi:hypothetical protein